MTERDAFEVRFAAAVRGYAGRVSSDLDPVELAHRIAAREPRRHGLAAALTWRGLAIPRRAWVLLLLAALLLAIVAGMLVAGSQPVRKLPAVVLPVGPVATCPPGSTPDAPGPVDQARPPQDAPWAMAFDRRAGRLVALVGAEFGVETWTFDVCTNIRTQLHPNREPPSLDFGLRLVYDVDSDLTITVSSGTVWAYDLVANTWTEKGAAPIDATPWAYDPGSGFVVATAKGVLWNYDIDTDGWTPIHQASPPADSWAYGVVFAYDASVDRLIAYSRGASGSETWLLDIRTGTWAKSGAVTPLVISGMGLVPAIEYDEAAQRTVVFGNARMAAYDAAADRWEILVGVADPDQGGFWFGPSGHWGLAAYDPVNERLVGPGQANGVWAFDPATRRWTVLLEASAAGTAMTGDGSVPAVSPRPGWVAALEAMLPSNVNGVSFRKTSVTGGVPSTRLGNGGWGTVPLGSDGLETFLKDYGKTLADLDVAIATATDASMADTFAIAFRVNGADATELAVTLAAASGVGPGVRATVGGKQVQAVREIGGMGFDLYVKGDVVFYVFTDGTSLIDGIVAALP